MTKNSDKEKNQPIPSITIQSPFDSATDVPRESLIEFPTRFPIKAIGKHSEAFKQAVAEIVANKIAKSDLIDVQEQFSSHERYLSITINATFYNQAAIDAVYHALSDEPLVIMAL